MLNREETAQLENFVNLLVDLSIVEPSKQVSKILLKHEKANENESDALNQSQNSLNSSRIHDSYDEEYFARENKFSAKLFKLMVSRLKLLKEICRQFLFK